MHLLSSSFCELQGNTDEWSVIKTARNIKKKMGGKNGSSPPSQFPGGQCDLFDFNLSRHLSMNLQIINELLNFVFIHEY